MSESLSTSATPTVARVQPPSRAIEYRIVERRTPTLTYTVVAHPPTRRT